MGKNQVQATGSQGRKDLLQFDPEDLAIITDKSHPLYDPRAELPVSEAMVLNVKALGVLQPVIVRRNGERDGVAIMEVVAGRQRVKAAREANKRLRAEGGSPMLVGAIVKRADDASLFATIVAENEARQDDSPMGRARKLARYLAFGVSEAEAAIVFRVSESTIRGWLALLDCDKSVQDAVERGQLPATTAAQEFAKMPREEQAAHLAALVANGATLTGETGRENVRRARAGEPAEEKPRTVNRRRLEKAIEVLPRGHGEFQDGFRAALDWVVGKKPKGWAETQATLRAAGIVE